RPAIDRWHRASHGRVYFFQRSAVGSRFWALGFGRLLRSINAIIGVVTRIIALIVLVSAAALAADQTSVGGEWAVTFSTPNGPVEFTMYLSQEGTRLSGRLTSDAGEFPL